MSRYLSSKSSISVPPREASRPVADGPSRCRRPVHVLELRAADGPGGGPEKTIIQGAALTNPERARVTVCYLRHEADASDELAERARALGLDYLEIRQRRRDVRESLKQLRQLVRKREIDVVHAHEYKSDFIAAYLANAEGTIPLATAHGWTGHSVRERWAYYPLDRRILTRFPKVLAVSGQIRGELIRAGASPERVETLLNGIDPDLYRLDQRRVAVARDRFAVRPGEIAIGSVGRIEPQKRFDLLVEAFARLRTKDRRLRLLLAGEGSLRAWLMSRADALGLGDSCCFVGHCPEVGDFYHALDVFVQSSDYEGTPNVVLEAMALEVPIVATDVGGTAELITDGVHGLIIPPGDSSRIAHALTTTLADKASTTRRIAAARRRVEVELSFQNRCRRLEEIYEQLVLGSELASSARSNEIPKEIES